MSDLVIESFETSKSYLNSRDEEEFDIVMQLEEMINDLDKQLTRYLLEIAKKVSTTDYFVKSMQLVWTQ
ncbi:PhoU domain-containing protein [Erysipelothrix sp. D19-032]